MLLETIKNIGLYEDVKKQFENHCNLKSACEILKDDQFEVNTFCNSGDIKKIYYDFYKWEETYQSSSNVFKNAQINQISNWSPTSTDKILKSNPEKNGFFINGEPYKNDASEALYIYLLHFLIIQLFEQSNGLENIRGVLKCAMCETTLNRTDPKCSACGEPNESTIEQLFQQFESRKNKMQPEDEKEKEIEETMRNIAMEKENLEAKEIDKRKTKKKRKSKSQSKPEKQMMELKINIGEQLEVGQEKGKLEVQASIEDQTEIKQEEQFVEPDMNMGNQLQDEGKRENDQSALKTGNEEGKNDQMNVEKSYRESRREAFPIETDQWKCRHCEARNENDFVTCIVCMKERQDEWKCNRCSLLNEMSEEKCAACGNKNENIKEKWCSTFNGGKTIRDTPGKQVESWFDEISTKVQDGIKSIGNILDPPFGDIGEEIKQKGEDKEKKDYGAANTSGVHEYQNVKWNNKLPNLNLTTSVSKFCRNCWKNETICELCSRCLSIRWDCSFKFCGKENFGGEYCRHCGMEKYPNKKIGATMRQRTSGSRTRHVWICEKCDTINEKRCKSCLGCQLPRPMEHILRTGQLPFT